MKDRELYKALLNTADNAGLKILSDDFCCKLLAFVYAYGGNTEMTVINVKMNEDIRYAQKRLNIYGGEVPNVELVDLLKKYLDEIKEIAKAPTKESNCKHPDWAFEICERYGISKKIIN